MNCGMIWNAHWTVKQGNNLLYFRLNLSYSTRLYPSHENVTFLVPKVHQLPVGCVLPLIWDSLDILALILLPVVAMQYQTLFWSETTVVEFTLLSITPLSTSHKFKPNCKNTCGQANLLLMQSETAINQCSCTASASLMHYLHNYKQQFFRLSQSCCHSPLLGM